MVAWSSKIIEDKFTNKTSNTGIYTKNTKPVIAKISISLRFFCISLKYINANLFLEQKNTIIIVKKPWRVGLMEIKNKINQIYFCCDLFLAFVKSVFFLVHHKTHASEKCMFRFSRFIADNSPVLLPSYREGEKVPKSFWRWTPANFLSQ